MWWNGGILARIGICRDWKMQCFQGFADLFGIILIMPNYKLDLPCESIPLGDRASGNGGGLAVLVAKK